MEKCFKPLFEAKDIHLTISLKEFYELTKIELHFFVFELNSFLIEDISHLTHPDVMLLDALFMTCSLPILTSPICLENKCYIDGGILCNYPLKYCIDSGKKEDEILGFKNKYNTDNINTVINSESTLLDFIMSFLFKIIYSFSTSDNQPTIQHEIISNTNMMNIHVMRDVLSNSTKRNELFNIGKKEAIEFLNKYIINK
jgi:predicted acylesterase/phospholipase RssA